MSTAGNQLSTSVPCSSTKCVTSRATYRISDLPDGVLQDILSYLPASEVVRKSILSSQWRELWTAVPYLQADQESEFGYDKDRFIDFASCLLKRRSYKLHSKF